MSLFKRIFSGGKSADIHHKPQPQRQAGQRAELPAQRGETGDYDKGVKPDSNPSLDSSSNLFTDQHAMVISILSPEDIKRLNGIPAPATMASFVGAKHPPRLRGNPAFLAFFRDFMNRRAIHDPGVVQSALAQKEGFIYFIDIKTPDGVFGRVPPEDIMGCFKVTGGKVVAGSFDLSSNYCVYREGRGIMELPGPLQRALYEEMLALPPCPSS